jgi:hypothetical protein
MISIEEAFPAFAENAEEAQDDPPARERFVVKTSLQLTSDFNI